MDSLSGLDRGVAERVILGINDDISIAELASAFSAPRTRIRQTLNRLVKLGYPLILRRDIVQRRAFRLLDAQKLRADLSPWRIGQRIEWRLHTSSTQDELKRIAQTSEDGTVLLAETQYLGRGRRPRSWFSPFGGIWMSVLLRPTWPNSHQILTLGFALAVTRALSVVAKVPPLLKWPNDVMIRSRKVAGVLAEATYEGSKLNNLIVGLGVNANIRPALFQKALRRTATSISQELCREVDRNELSRNILEEMDNVYRRFESGRASELRDEAKSVCCTLGRKVRVTTAERVFEGQALDLGSDGQLVVRLKDRAEIELYAADVVHLR